MGPFFIRANQIGLRSATQFKFENFNTEKRIYKEKESK